MHVQPGSLSPQRDTRMKASQHELQQIHGVISGGYTPIVVAMMAIINIAADRECLVQLLHACSRGAPSKLGRCTW